MKNPAFILQAGNILSTEKAACCFSSYPIRYCKLEEIGRLDPDEVKFHCVPVGSVEFTREYANHIGLQMPNSLTYPEDFRKFLYREIREGTYKDADSNEFVKPKQTKVFTGAIKSEVDKHAFKPVDPDTPVWVSEAVPFESEFRFYIQDYLAGPKIIGWSRYDDLLVANPEPDFAMVEEIANEFHWQLGPNAYSVDIGWRPDLGKYSLVEINDGWALGLYVHIDPQSNPPTRQQYADMLVSRWTQILFCNIV